MICQRSWTLRDFYAEVYRPQRLLAPGTQQLYTDALNHLARHFGCDPHLNQLDDDVIAELMTGLVNTGRSPATANRVRAHLLALWRYARRRHLTEVTPEVDRLRCPKRIPRAWTIDQLGRLLRTAGAQRGLICGIPAGAWWTALILTLYDTGLRISALMLLRWSDLQTRPAPALCVRFETQKQQADQYLGLSVQTMQALALIRGQGQRMFPWPYDTGPGAKWRCLTEHLRRLLKRAGLEYGRRDLFHRFRRTHASYVKATGGDPTQQLGHSSAQVTAAYLDPMICAAPRWVDHLPRPEQPERQLTLF